jgi:putative addiction module component (TIGR02574 family)
MSTTEIRELALKLPPDDRAILARDLLESLESAESSKQIEEAWIAEFESRANDYDAGLLSADDWQVSLDRARERFRQGRAS